MTLNHTGALLLSAAIAKFFPKEQIEFSSATPQGFTVAFTHSEPFQEAYHQSLETIMKTLSGEKVKIKEMIASNARELFLHKGQKGVSISLQGIEGTVEVAQIGDSIYLTTGPLQKCHHFTLFKFEQENQLVTLHGMAFPDGNAQKTFLKKWRQYPKKNHEFFAKELELYEDGIWHPRGVALRRTLIETWRHHLEKEGFFEILTSDPKDYFSKTGRKKFSIWNGVEDLTYCFNPESLTSSLQLIQKWINIFDFESSWVLHPKAPKILKQALATCGIEPIIEDGDDPSRVELRIADALGRYWTGPGLQVKKGGFWFSLFGDLHRFISLLLERYEGELPFGICPEQVRLLPVSQVDLEPVIKIFNRQNIRYFVDEGPTLLKEKMHRALRLKVPYVMVFGKREENNRQIHIRAFRAKSQSSLWSGTSSSLDETMTLEKMEQFLAERRLEN